MSALITTPKLMYVGGGAVDQLGDCLEKLAVTRPLIVTDPFMVNSGKISAVTAPLTAAKLDYGVFSKTVP